MKSRAGKQSRERMKIKNNHTIQGKKGQATLFIIIGIILLIGITLIIVFRNDIRQIITQAPNQAIVTEVPPEFVPVSDYVSTCLQKTSIDGLKIIGEHGGYLDPIASGKKLAISSDPMQGSALNLMNNINLSVPYWYYLDAPNDCSQNCKFAFGWPYLRKEEGSPNIESDLESYIHFNLNTCLNDFKPLKDEGYAFTKVGNITPKVTITDTRILVSLDFPVSVSHQGSSHDLDTFLTTVELNLDRIYNLAKRLTEYEADYHYLDKHSANLIVAYSGLDKSIPPMADVTLEFGKTHTWQKDKVRQNLIMVMESNTPLFQVENTRNFEQRIMGSDFLDALYNRGTNIPNNFSDQDLNVYFNYYASPAGYDPYFDLNCRGNSCGPLSVSSNLVALIGLQRYQFFYDLSYPVLVEINSPDELSDQIKNGYRFNFFLQSNLRSNAPLESDYESQSQIDVGRTLFCDEDKRNSGNITINMTDALSGAPLPDVTVAYGCGEDHCIVGSTGPSGSLKTRFPVCFGGIISFIKDGYSQMSLPFNVNLGESKKVSQSIAPTIEKKVQLKKKMLYKDGDIWKLDNNLVPLDKSEDAFVVFNRIEGPHDMPYSAFVALNLTTENETITLTPGSYNVQVTMTLNEPVNIPSETKGLAKVPALSLNETPSGGLNLEVNITEDDLRKDEITIITMGFDPRTFKSADDMNVLGMIDPYSITFKNELQPMFS